MIIHRISLISNFKMSLPRCPICLNKYSCSRIPYILQPCSHGLCKSCVDEYIVTRGNTLCPKCRTHVDRHTVNFDLKDMCDVSVDGWKDGLMEALSVNPGVPIQINESLLPAAQLITCRLKGDREVHRPLVDLIRHCEQDEVYSWVDVLQFPIGWDIDRKVTRLLRRHEFCEKHDAGWLLEFI